VDFPSIKQVNGDFSLRSTADVGNSCATFQNLADSGGIDGSLVCSDKRGSQVTASPSTAGSTSGSTATGGQNKLDTSAKIGIGVGVGVGVALLLLIVALFMLRRRRKAAARDRASRPSELDGHEKDRATMLGIDGAKHELASPLAQMPLGSERQELPSNTRPVELPATSREKADADVEVKENMEDSEDVRWDALVDALSSSDREKKP
jgi:hypothetical protein